MSFVKFIKITTTHTEEALNAKLAALKPVEVDNVSKLYAKFNHIEFSDANDCKCMFAVIHENYIADLLEAYVTLSINFIYEDLTKDVLYGNFDINKFGWSELLKPMVESFIDSNLDVDTVLDKISALGKESLNEKDMLVLTNI